MKLVALLVLGAACLNAADTLKVFGKQWTVPQAADWHVDHEGPTEVLRMLAPRGPVAGVPRRPTQFALADVGGYTRVTVEADVKPLGRSLLIVFAYRDDSHFNYAHLSTDTGAKQPVHNGVFHVYGGERVRISSEGGPASFPVTGRWYRVRLTHDSAAGTVEVTVDDERVLALKAVDLSLGAGKIGLGSFDEKAEFKNVRITPVL